MPRYRVEVFHPANVLPTVADVVDVPAGQGHAQALAAAQRRYAARKDPNVRLWGIRLVEDPNAPAPGPDPTPPNPGPQNRPFFEEDGEP